MARQSRNRGILFGAGLAAAGLAGATWARYRKEIRCQRKRVLEGSRIAETGCGPIEYAEAGAGSPVLLIHGAGGGYDQGLLLGAPLATHGFRVVAMSRFGYLRTPLPADGCAAAQADAHECLLDTLGIERAAVVGVSAGGPSAMQFALRHPDRTSALVLLVPAAYAPPARDTSAPRMPRGTRFLLATALKSDFLFWAAIRLFRRIVVRAILGTPPELVEKADTAEKARLAAILREILPVSSRQAGLLNDAAVVTALPRYQLEKIAAPTLVISVPDDFYRTYAGARYTAGQVPGARFRDYPSGGHMLVGHNDEVLTEIAAFLKEKQVSRECAPDAVTPGGPPPVSLEEPALPA